MQTVFVETPIFTKLANGMLSVADRESVTEVLTENLRAGEVIRGSGGMRKLRMPGSGRGKRGGFRVIYAIRSEGKRTFLIYLFAKGDTEDLTKDEYRQLAKLLEATP
jgi:hypothetical protein